MQHISTALAKLLKQINDKRIINNKKKL